MEISGLQKLSLLDYPGQMCSVVFLQGCNFRCPFCHNPELIDLGKKGIFDVQELFAFLKKKKGFIDGVCITGGEPTLQKALPEFIEKIKVLGFLVKLDTNGSNPDMLRGLIENKMLNYIAMDLKSSWSGYESVIGRKSFVARCRESMKMIQESGIKHEFRTTVFPEKHEEKNFFDIAKDLKKGEKYCLQNIEYRKNLDESLDQSKKIDVSILVSNLRKNFPDLIIEERGK